MLPIEQLSCLLDVALDDIDGPEGIHVLVGKVLQHVVVPHVPLVHKLLASLVRVVRILSSVIVSYGGQSLLATSEVGMVREVEALLLEELLDSISIVRHLLVHLTELLEVLVKRH